MSVTDKRDFKFTPEELKELRICRNNAIFKGLGVSALSWLSTRFIIYYTPLVKTSVRSYSSLFHFLAASAGFLYGAGSTRDDCLNRLSHLENSRLAKFANFSRALKEDRAHLSKEDFDAKYRTIVGQSGSFNLKDVLVNMIEKDEAESKTQIKPQTDSSGTQPSIFENFNQINKETPSKPKSFTELQNLNRSKSLTPDSSPKTPKPIQNEPDSPIKEELDFTMPPPPTGKLKVKRNQYGDIIYSDD